MVGFQKYERLLNKKRKREAYINLVASNAQNIVRKITCSNGSDTSNESGLRTRDTNTENELAVNELSKSVMEECSRVKKKYMDLRKERMERPKLYLEARGERSLLTGEAALHFPLSFSCIQDFLLQALVGRKAPHLPGWCHLLRRNRLSKVVVVIVEGLGLSELATINDWQEDSSSAESLLSPERRAEEVKPQMEEEELKGSSSDSSSKRNEGGSEEREPPSKRLKSLPEEVGEDLNGISSETDEVKKNHPELLLQLLPRSSPLFALHLEVEAPSQCSSDPVEELFSMSLSKSFSRKIQQEYSCMSEAAEDKSVMKIYSTTVASKRQLVETNHKDQMNRLELLLSPQELVDCNFPFNLEGNMAFNNPEFKPLHPVVDKVTSSSSMFGVDCEMCVTTLKNELTRVSVVDEQLNIVYTSYVKPTNRIVNYLTQYSGITPRHLQNVTTTVEDVQKHLRRILPRDAILVGHSLNGDLEALKLCHPYVIDTSLIYNLSGYRHTRPGLKLLNKLFLGKVIQRSDVRGHDPSEDAGASIEIALLKLRHDSTYGDAVKRGYLPFGQAEQRKTELEVKIAKRNSRFTLPLFQEEFKRNIFMYTKLEKHESAIITTKKCVDQFSLFAQSEPEYLTSFGVEDMKQVFKTTSENYSRKKFLVCHCKVSDSFLDPSKAAAKEELKQLDRRLKRLHNSMVENTLILTLFTGSPWSVPLNRRSNGILMVDVIGQERKNYFRYKSLD